MAFKALVIVALLLLVGCAVSQKTIDAPKAALNNVFQAEQGVMLLIQEQIGPAYLKEADCKAGLAQADIEFGTLGPESKAAANGLMKMGNRDNDLYRGCYGTGIWVYYLWFRAGDYTRQAAPVINGLISAVGMGR